MNYDARAFHLQDSASFHAFAHLPLHERPKQPALQRRLSKGWYRGPGADMETCSGARIEKRLARVLVGI